jgi:phosphate transport system substrate-binding protein
MSYRFWTILAFLFLTACFALPASAEVIRADDNLPDYKRETLPAQAQVIRATGSTTLSPLLHRWGEDFRRIYPQVQINVAGGGSSAGFTALLEGAADLAAMSRPANARELEIFTKKFGYPPAQIAVGIDAIAIYVHKDNPVKSISMKQLDALFSADSKRGGAAIRTWGELGATGEWVDKTITLRGPARTHGMYALFREAVLEGSEYRLELNSEIVPSIIVQNIGADERSIGFASHYFETQRTRMLAVSTNDTAAPVAPTQASSLNGTYPLARQLFIYLNLKPNQALPAAVAAYLRFTCSKQGQAGAVDEGSYAMDAAMAAKDCLSRLR